MHSNDADQHILGVLFVDIVDSTRLYRTLGDARARELVLGCLERLSDVVMGLGGTIIDRIGDELMCTFDSDPGTVAAAVALQQAVTEWSRAAEAGMELSVRIGLEVGPVVLESGRVFGKTVYTARRMATLAKPRQVVTTASTAARPGMSNGFVMRFVDRVVLKGDRSPTEVLEIVWDPVVATRPHLVPDAGRTPAGVWLLHVGRELIVDEEGPEITIGRARSCDLVVPGDDVSWLHARIQCRKGRPSLTDVSTNGTYVRLDGASASTLVHRDTVQLVGRGHLGMGCSPIPGDATTVEFACRASP